MNLIKIDNLFISCLFMHYFQQIMKYMLISQVLGANIDLEQLGQVTLLAVLIVQQVSLTALDLDGSVV